MNPSPIVAILAELQAKYPRFTSFYHFTDASNLPLIRAHGLLSLKELRAAALLDKVKFCSDDLSQESDIKHGIDSEVRLCFLPEHPMAHSACTRRLLIHEEVLDLRFIPVSLSVLNLPGVRIADGVAYAKNTTLYAVDEGLRRLDLDALFGANDWRDPVVKVRRKEAKKYETLVPHRIPPEYLTLPHG